MTSKPRITHRSITTRATALFLAAGLIISTGCTASTNTNASTRRTTTTTAASAPTRTKGDSALFDATTVHDIAVTFDDDDFTKMISAYESTGDKNWIEAAVTIDGTTFDKVGLKLKGNSSLRGAAQSDAQDLPWRIRLDKFVDGQSFGDHTEIVIRSNNSATSLNEAVALDLLDAVGLAAVAAAPARFSTNGSDPTLRLMVELPEDSAFYEAAFDGDGALFKASSTGDWTWKGDDAASYADSFEQKSGKDVTDLQPLVDFLDFLNNSDDTTFASELPERLDVDAFATYLAMMDLLGNFDDISGPGNNAYLWWDAKTKAFTVVPWDMNLALGGSMGGGPGGAGMPGSPPTAANTDGATPPTDPMGAPAPRALRPTDDNTSATNDATTPPVAAADEPGANGMAPTDRRGGMRNKANPLVERFHANATFEALYQEKLKGLEAELIDSGKAAKFLDERAKALTLHAKDLVDAGTVSKETNSITSALKR